MEIKDLSEAFGERIVWESAVQAAAGLVVGLDGTVLDVGGNLGAVAIGFGRITGPVGKVYTFEPNPRLWPTIFRNIAINNASTVTHVPLAVSDVSLEVKNFFCEDSFYEAGSGFHDPGGLSKPISVTTVSLDDWCEANNVSPDLIKIDIEGGEIFALIGASRTLRRVAPSLIIEYATNSEEGEHNPLQFLQKFGYRFFDANLLEEATPESYKSMYPNAGVMVNVLAVAEPKLRPLTAVLDAFTDIEIDVPQLARNDIVLPRLDPGLHRFLIELVVGKPEAKGSLALKTKKGDLVCFYEARLDHLSKHCCSALLAQIRPGEENLLVSLNTEDAGARIEKVVIRRFGSS